MRVELTPQILDSTEHIADILTLLGFFKSGQHKWHLKPADYEPIADYLRKHAPTLQPAYVEMARKSATRSVAYDTPAPDPPVHIAAADIADHVHDLARPALIVVENSANDGHFIKTIATVFGGSDVLLALEKDWLEILHGGGGGDARRLATEKAARFRRVRRVALLVDSDRYLPGDLPKDHDKLQEVQSAGVPVHVLELREAENYVPNRVLSAACALQQLDGSRVEALTTFDENQRGYFDMKKGFKKRKIFPPQRPLFQGVAPTVIIELEHGFGDKLLKLLAEHAADLTEDDFRVDVGAKVPEEMRAILAMLRKIV